MSKFLDAITSGRMDRQNDELETSLRVTGQIFEVLPLSVGHTSLIREVFTDGSTGDVQISTQERQESMSVVRYQRYIVQDGEVFTLPDYAGETPMPVGGMRKVGLIAKLVLGRVDHAEAKIEFLGIDEDLS